MDLWTLLWQSVHSVDLANFNPQQPQLVTEVVRVGVLDMALQNLVSYDWGIEKHTI